LLVSTYTDVVVTRMKAGLDAKDSNNME
jgi:hypothetical protein